VSNRVSSDFWFLKSPVFGWILDGIQMFHRLGMVGVFFCLCRQRFLGGGFGHHHTIAIGLVSRFPFLDSALGGHVRLDIDLSLLRPDGLFLGRPFRVTLVDQVCFRFMFLPLQWFRGVTRDQRDYSLFLMRT